MRFILHCNLFFMPIKDFFWQKRTFFVYSINTEHFCGKKVYYYSDNA